MSDPPHLPELPDNIEKERESNFALMLALGAAVVLLLIGGFYLVGRMTRSNSPAAQQQPLPMGAAEQAYAERIQFLDIQMSRAANFLNQEFTYVTGNLSNDGTRTIRAVELTIEFHDPFNQVILREKQRVISQQDRPLPGGLRQPFQITFEHIPDEWNHQYPSIRVTGLLLE
ncbi:MAG: hypothetical protein ACRD4K_12475 [Candidatus Acidiferrales bacterium]